VELGSISFNHDEVWHELESFRVAIVRVWKSVTSHTQYLHNLYQSMPGWLQQCIAIDGDIVD
jgi:hypothetical protein